VEALLQQLGHGVEHFFVSMSLWFWTGLIMVVFFLFPVAKILRRTGHNPLWCLVCLVPFFVYVELWVFAFKGWPSDSKAPDTYGEEISPAVEPSI
jgi:hypothetical protein